MVLQERWKVVFGVRKVGRQVLSRNNINKYGLSCSLTIKKSHHVVRQISLILVLLPGLTVVGLDPVVEDFELLQQFRDTASELQHPLTQVGVPANAVQSVLDVMAKHMTRIVGRYGIGLEEHSELNETTDIPMELCNPRTDPMGTTLNTPTTRVVFPDDSWPSPDLSFISAKITTDLFNAALLDNLGTLSPRGADATNSVEFIEPNTAFRQMSRGAHAPSPTPSVNLDDFMNSESDFRLTGTSNEPSPISWSGNGGSSPRVDEPMPIDPMFGR